MADRKRPGVQAWLDARFARKDPQKYLDEPARCSAFAQLEAFTLDRRPVFAAVAALALTACGGGHDGDHVCTSARVDGTAGEVCTVVPNPPLDCSKNPDVCR
jgi:hypothetical protein